MGISMQRVRLGMLTPSSNTVLEPVTTAMLTEVPEVSAHFGRFKVTEIRLTPGALGQFDLAPMLEAASLLADAKVDVIAWNGTSSAWLGFPRDEELCRQIEATTGAKAASSMLALNEVLAKLGAKSFGLVTPYLDDVQARIIANYASIGIDCRTERHFDDPGNFSFALHSPERIEQAVREVVAEGAKIVAIVCTNLAGAPLVDRLERELGVLILDSISVVVWKSLVAAGVDPRRITGWGRLFREM